MSVHAAGAGGQVQTIDWLSCMAQAAVEFDDQELSPALKSENVDPQSDWKSFLKPSEKKPEAVSQYEG